MGATDEERHDIGYCVAAAMTQLEDLDEGLREEALKALAAAVSAGLNATCAARGDVIEAGSSRFVYRTAVAELTIGLELKGRLKKRERNQLVACLRDYIQRLKKGG